MVSGQGRRRMAALVVILFLGSPVLGIATSEAGQFYEELERVGRAEYTHAQNSVNIEGSQAGTVFASHNLAAGNEQTCGILHNGSMICWGSWGSTSILPAYMDLGGNRSVVSVDSGTQNNARVTSCGIFDNGRVYCWGTNENVFLSGSGSAYTPVEIPLPSSRSATAVSVGSSHACAVLDNGSAMCWGSNLYYALGMPYEVIGGLDVVQQKEPPTYVDFGFDADVVGISAGSNTGCAILANYSLYCWGAYPGHQIEPHPNPTWINLGENLTAKAIDTQYHKCVILNDGSVKCWGSGSFGALGNGQGSGQEGTPISVNIGNLAAVSVSVGIHHTCVLLEDNSVKCWGANGLGQLGIGHYYNYAYPVNVPFPTGKTVIAIEAGAYHSCALYDGGEIDCWGMYNRLGYIPPSSANINSTGQSEMTASCPACSNFNLGEVDSDGDGAIEYLEDYPGNPNKSIRCQEGAYGAHSCIDASIGHYVDVEGSIEQYQCASGTFQPNTGQSSCLDADPGHYVPTAGRSTQTICLPGTYQPSAGQSNCIGAAPGHFVAILGSTFQTPCAVGSYQPHALQNSCTEADPGHYVVSTGSYSQETCEPGTFQPSMGLGYCLQSDPGHFVEVYGSSTQTQCTPGTYQPDSGSTYCVDAGAGHHVLLSAATAQDECAAGTFQPLGAQDSCLPSEPGHYAPVSALSAQIPCHDGMFQPDYGQTDCDEVPPGYFASGAGMEYPEPCPAGTYQPLAGQNQCVDAALGHYVPEGASTEQTECQPGAFQPEGGTDHCVAASPGYYVESHASTQEVPASVDFYAEGYGNTAQTPCPSGHITVGGASSSAEHCLIDSDGDRIPNQEDSDDDNDGWTDAEEHTCGSNSLNQSSIPLDTDNDHDCDLSDTDDDGDGWPDSIDSFPLDRLEWSDLDGDGVGDNSDKLPSIARYQSYSDLFIDIAVILLALLFLKSRNGPDEKTSPKRRRPSRKGSKPPGAKGRKQAPPGKRRGPPPKRKPTKVKDKTEEE